MPDDAASRWLSLVLIAFDLGPAREQIGMWQNLSLRECGASDQCRPSQPDVLKENRWIYPKMQAYRFAAFIVSWNHSFKYGEKPFLWGKWAGIALVDLPVRYTKIGAR